MPATSARRVPESLVFAVGDVRCRELALEIEKTSRDSGGAVSADGALPRKVKQFIVGAFAHATVAESALREWARAR